MWAIMGIAFMRAIVVVLTVSLSGRGAPTEADGQSPLPSKVGSLAMFSSRSRKAANDPAYGADQSIDAHTNRKGDGYRRDQPGGESG